MIDIRKFVGFLMAALLLGAFALPVNAGNDKKQYSLVMSVPPNQAPAPGVPFTVKATIKNVGNSSIHSFQLFVTGVTVVGVNKLDDAKVTFTGSTITVTKADDLESGESRTVTIQVNTCGDGQWLASVWNGAQLNGQSFSLVPPPASNLTSSIPCGPPPTAGATFTVPDTLNPACVTGQRGYYDKDGSIPVAVPVFVTNTVSVNQQLHFRWPDFQAGGDPLATFDYFVCATGPVPALGSTLVAWLNDNGHPASEPGNPAYIPAQPCNANANFLPAPYGTLTADLLPSDSTLAIDTSTPARQSPLGTPPGSIDYPGSPPTSPQNPGTAFDVVIGTERITVQLVCLDNDGDNSDPGDCTEIGGGEGTALEVVNAAWRHIHADCHPLGRGIGYEHAAAAPRYGCFDTAIPVQPFNQALMCIRRPSPGNRRRIRRRSSTSAATAGASRRSDRGNQCHQERPCGAALFLPA